MTSANSIYVGLTRAKEQIQVFTNNFNQPEQGQTLKEQVQNWVRKSSTLDYDDRTVAYPIKDNYDGLQAMKEFKKETEFMYQLVAGKYSDQKDNIKHNLNKDVPEREIEII